MTGANLACAKLYYSVSSTDENEKLSCSNGKVSTEDWIVEWAKDNNNSLLQIVCSFYSMHFHERGGEITFKPLEHLQTRWIGNWNRAFTPIISRHDPYYAASRRMSFFLSWKVAFYATKDSSLRPQPSVTYEDHYPNLHDYAFVYIKDEGDADYVISQSKNIRIRRILHSSSLKHRKMPSKL
ncbi:hypothetical protein POM88_024924 [Heracleum sosnowskyi]|uniref:Uncharacterized protein n=1 Tax=Heracleum sosnowskyi TaxID=360622 RepID=A0AAD8MJA9_9APIA|nr:hypothetical protein POM88_024924 [Heracleum sosnowskyi]